MQKEIQRDENIKDSDVKREDRKERFEDNEKVQGRSLSSQFGFFGPVTFLNAVIYVFCTFKNPSGITYPIFIGVSLIFLGVALAKLGRPLQKNSLFYLSSMMLLGVSTFCTDDWRIIMLNKAFIFILLMILLIGQFCRTCGWQLGKHVSSILQLIFCSLGEMHKPFGDGLKYCKEKNKILSKKMAAVLIGIGVAIPLLWIVSILLAAADAVFGHIVDSVLQGIQITGTFGNVINVVFRILLFFVVIYAWLSYLSEGNISNESQTSRKGDPIIAITVTGILSAVYLLFCGIQIIYLFFGNGNLPEGYTYAGYAREGFFQLLAVSVLNLGIVLAGLQWFAESKVLKIILTVMSLCTFIMIVSSGLRMIMYIRYYFLTFQRVFVLWALVVLFVLFIGVMISIYKEKFELFRYGLVTITVLYLVFSFSHPDYYIAKVNLANAYQEGMEEPEPEPQDFFQSNSFYSDFWYMRKMCADAAPALIPYMAARGVDVSVFYEDNIYAGMRAERAEVMGSNSADTAEENSTIMTENAVNLKFYEKEHFLDYLNSMKKETEDSSWRSFNISRHIMLKIMEKYSEDF